MKQKEVSKADRIVCEVSDCVLFLYGQYMLSQSLGGPRKLKSGVPAEGDAAWLPESQQRPRSEFYASGSKTSDHVLSPSFARVWYINARTRETDTHFMPVNPIQYV